MDKPFCANPYCLHHSAIGPARGCILSKAAYTPMPHNPDQEIIPNERILFSLGPHHDGVWLCENCAAKLEVGGAEAGFITGAILNSLGRHYEETPPPPGTKKPSALSGASAAAANSPGVLSSLFKEA